MKKFLFNRTVFFILFALAAIILMGTTFTRPVSSDLHKTANTMVEESTKAFRNSSNHIALQHPGAILRANVIK